MSSACAGALAFVLVRIREHMQMRVRLRGGVCMRSSEYGCARVRERMLPRFCVRAVVRIFWDLASLGVCLLVCLVLLPCVLAGFLACPSGCPHA